MSDSIKEILSSLGKSHVGVEIVTVWDGTESPVLWHCSIGNEGDDVGVWRFCDEDLEIAVKSAYHAHAKSVALNKEIDW